MIYVMSDIHGNLERFESIMRQINLKEEDTLYILGDVIDRYPYGIKLLRKIMKMPNVKMLLGNHDYMMLQAIGHCKDAADEKKNASYTEDVFTYYLIQLLKQCNNQTVKPAVPFLESSIKAFLIRFLSFYLEYFTLQPPTPFPAHQQCVSARRGAGVER